jgi:hypothetical protein
VIPSVIPKHCIGGCGTVVMVKPRGRRMCLSCQRRKKAKREILVVIQKGWNVKVEER